jgi:glycosyltransferase involved in cell wall biosynthesis
MRIAMLVSVAFPPREGMGFYVWNLSRYLVRQGHTLHIITRGGIKPQPERVVDGITIWRPAFLPVYPYHVHLHGRFVTTLIRRLELELDLIHLHSPLSPAISTALPVIATFHSMVAKDVDKTPVKDFYTLLMKAQAPFSYGIESEIIKRAKAITAVSPPVAEDLHDYPLCPPVIDVSWNGVDVELFKPPESDDPKQKLVITVGRLSPGKGLEDLIAAASIVLRKDNEIRFLIVGDGISRSLLQNRVHQNGLERNIQFSGQISKREDLVSLYQKSALFVLPSHHEGLPTVVLEAMACGCPVLATRVGGIPWLIQDGENGCLVPPDNPSLLAEGILNLLADPELSLRLGKQARITIEDRFSWQRIGSWYIEKYKSITAGNPS